MKQQIINKYIDRIKTDYPEDDKIQIDLEQFLQEMAKAKAGQHETIVMLRNKIKEFKQAEEATDNCAEMLLSNPKSEEPAKLIEELDRVRKELYKEAT